jgi:hypothetical protein
MLNNGRNILLNLIAAVIPAALAYMLSFLCPDMRDDLRVLTAISIATVGLLSWHYVIRRSRELGEPREMAYRKGG